MERRMSVQRPLLNKKLFGTWAPVMLGGELVASLVAAGSPKSLSCVVTSNELLQTPATLTVKRAGARVTKTNGYGTTDAHLVPGEQVRLSLTRQGEIVSESVIPAVEANERSEVQWQRTTDDGEPALPGPLQLGCVSLLDGYLLIQRDGTGRLADVWLRCDTEPVVLVQADLYSDPSRTGRRRGQSPPKMCARDDARSHRITLASGLQYIEFDGGRGAAAAVGDVVTVRYSGSLLSRATRRVGVGVPEEPWQVSERSETFAVGGGRSPMWEEVAQGMHLGGRRQVLVPPSALLRPTKKGRITTIPAGDTASFECELRSIEAGALATAVRLGLWGQGSIVPALAVIALTNLCCLCLYLYGIS
jgi:hypothetical protein